MQPIPDFQISPHRGVEDGAPIAPTWVMRKYDDNHPLMRMVHIPRNHFVKPFFDKAFVHFTKNFTLLWGPYGGLRDHGLVKSCQEDPSTFSTVAEQNGTALFIAFLKARLVEVRDRGYALLDGFSDSNNTYFFNF